MTSETLSHSHSYQHASTACLNCGAATAGNYCQHCGQATHLHVPSAREFLHEFIAHYVALEGKLWKSLGKLIFKPGFLSREYIEGRRVRYLEPLRLYLTFSIIFFALVKLSGVQVIDFGEPHARPAIVAASDADDTRAGQELLDAELSSFEKKTVAWTASLNPALGEKTARFFALPRQQQKDAITRAFFAYSPYAIFALMPVFALYLKGLYLGSGRRYGEHFLFALHSNAFAFLMMSVMILTPASWDFVRLVLLLWLVFYLPIAMRRVYGGSRLATAARWMVLMVLHFVSLALALAIATAQALLG
ncbi:DUF3667 domain-containing protein [Massilia sp.]|uniref:DUF3667 domain-containing protein n=1 Tax=Massilia sp. TaxID=1882437 RepID=UPI00289A6D99|nr:DUF3667 domain-containing protein [Massilia sp.]